MFLALYGASLLIRTVWPPVAPYGDTFLLVALGLACVINFGRNRTVRCGLTGPLFLVAAAVAALVESGLWSANLDIIWGVVLIGIAIAFFVEWRVAAGQRSAQ